MTNNVTKISRHGPIVSVPYRGGMLTGPRDLVNQWIADSTRERALRARWPESTYDAMDALASLFPSMRELAACSPFNALELVKWLNGPAPTSGSRHAAMFLLNVWNPDTNWCRERFDDGTKLRGKPDAGRFNLGRAMSAWDVEHRAACLAWMEAPFWP